jgi:hypothetical protein
MKKTSYKLKMCQKGTTILIRTTTTPLKLCFFNIFFKNILEIHHFQQLKILKLKKYYYGKVYINFFPKLCNKKN